VAVQNGICFEHAYAPHEAFTTGTKSDEEPFLDADRGPNLVPIDTLPLL
jgi:hypothetical protein